MAERAWAMEQTDPELSLVGAMAAGDTAALNDLYQRYGLVILNFLIAELDDRQLAEEVLQDVMLAVWRGAQHFRGESQVRTWVFAIARKQMLKARQRRRPISDALCEESAIIQLEVADLDQLARQEALAAALDKLPHDQQEALELVFFRDMSGPQAAHHLNIPLNTLKSRLLRARRALRGLLNVEGDL